MVVGITLSHIIPIYLSTTAYCITRVVFDFLVASGENELSTKGGASRYITRKPSPLFKNRLPKGSFRSKAIFGGEAAALSIMGHDIWVIRALLSKKDGRYSNCSSLGLIYICHFSPAININGT